MSPSASPAHHEIRVEGPLDSRRQAWPSGLQFKTDGAQTVISGLLPDQPALHGLLAKIHDLGLCLISVRQLDPHETENGPAVRCQPPRSPQYRAAVLLALAVMAFELVTLAWIRRRFFGTGFLRSFISVTLGGAIIVTISAALGAVS